MTLSRRDFLRAAGAAGVLLATRPSFAAAPTTGASRASRLFRGTRLAHADLHNHSHLSDGAGDPEATYATIRKHGLDVAALTDHSTLSWSALGIADPCGKDGSPPHGTVDDCQSLAGINEAGWLRAGLLADAANAGSFTAIRGFEWSSPFLGHMNVWFSSRWIDPTHTLGWSPTHVPQDLYDNLDIPPELVAALDEVARANPTRGSGMQGFYDWLNKPREAPVFGGGLDGIAGFNHPGRETGRFDFFRYFPQMAGRVVSMEIFNRSEDYIFEAYDAGRPSPLTECLNAGWRVGLIGVADEHGTDWGGFTNKGRAGLWVSEMSRRGVKESMLARRVFAARVAGLRLDAAANGTRMGGIVPHRSGPVRFALDLDRGRDHWGLPVRVQVLRPGSKYPEVVHQFDTRFRTGQQPIIRFSVPLNVDDGSWVVLRIVDPTLPKKSESGPASPPWDKFSLAYTSPFWLEPRA